MATDGLAMNQQQARLLPVTSSVLLPLCLSPLSLSREGAQVRKSFIKGRNGTWIKGPPQLDKFAVCYTVKITPYDGLRYASKWMYARRRSIAFASLNLVAFIIRTTNNPSWKRSWLSISTCTIPMLQYHANLCDLEKSVYILCPVNQVNVETLASWLFTALMCLHH